MEIDKIEALIQLMKDSDLKVLSLENEDVKRFIDGKEVVKKIYVPGKIYTIVIK